MNPFMPCIIFLLYCAGAHGQEMDCSKFKVGKFILTDTGTHLTTLFERNDSLQTETIKVDGKEITTTFFIKWVSDCTYTLVPTRETLERHKDLDEKCQLSVTILNIDANSYWVETSANFSSLKLTSLIRKE